MTDSTKYEELCSALLDGELSREERRAFEAEMQADPECAAYMEDLRYLKEAWHVLEEPGPLTMHEDIMAKITEEAQKNVIPLEKKRRVFPVFTVLAAAVACVMLAVSGTLGNWFGNTAGKNNNDDAAMDGGAAVSAVGSVKTADAATQTRTMALDAATMTAAETQPDARMKDARPEQDNLIEEDLEKLFMEPVELPLSIRQQAYASCYMAVGKGELPVMDNVTLLEEKENTSFFKVENNMNRLEQITETLAQSGYQMVLREDIGLRINEKAADVLLIIKTP